MTWGDVSFSQWGGFEWGEFLLLDALRFFGDVTTILEDVDKGFSGDVLALITPDKAFSGDLLALGLSVDKRWDADVFVTRLPTDRLSRGSIQPVVLVELLLRSGTIRVAARDLTAASLGWEGRLINASSVERALGDRVDDLRLDVADPLPDGTKITDLFDDTNPPEGTEVVVYLLALDDIRESLIEVFRGRIEEVAGISPGRFSLEVVRSDATLDRILTRTLDLASFPGAPDDSVGRTIPPVFGEVEEHLGLVTQFNPISSLKQAMSETDTVVRLRDATKFANTGSATVDDEEIAWTSKVGDDLLGVTRGQSGTEVDAHPSGAVVITIGTLEVLFADHALTSIDDVRIEDDLGLLVVPEPLPTLNPATARATWPVTPTFEVASRSVEGVVVGFDGVGPINTASNPLRAARESNQFDDLNFATITQGQRLQLSRTAAVGELGEITRVGLVTVHDPATGNGATVTTGTGAFIGTLSPGNNLPSWVIRRLERQFRSTFAINDPSHTHPTSSRQVITRPAFSQTPDKSLVPGPGWFFPAKAHDGSQDPNNSFAWTDENENLVSLGSTINLGSDEVITGGFLRLFSGGLVVLGFDTPGRIRLYWSPNVFPSGPSQNPGAAAFVDWPPRNQPSFPRNVPSFVDSAPIPSFLFPPAAQFPGIVFLVQPRESVIGIPLGDPDAPNGKLFKVTEMELHMTVSRAIQNAVTGTSQRRGVPNFFDVTSQVQGDWGFFTDPARGGTASVINSTTQTHLVHAMFWVIEVRPFVRSAIEVPNVFARVRGLVPNGEPTEVLKQVITNAPPLGLGLPSSTIVQGTYSPAAASQVASGLRVDFALREPTSGLALIRRVAEQSDLRAWWQNGRHHVRRKPIIASLPAVFKSYNDDDLLRGSLDRKRARVDTVRNDVEADYRPLDRTGAASRVVRVSDGASIALFGELREVQELDLVRSDTAATEVVTQRLARSRLPRWLVRFVLPLAGLELRRGDLVALSHTQFAFGKAEVLSLPISLSGFLAVEVSCVVWEE